MQLGNPAQAQRWGAGIARTPFDPRMAGMGMAGMLPTQFPFGQWFGGMQ